MSAEPIWARPTSTDACDRAVVLPRTRRTLRRIALPFRSALRSQVATARPRRDRDRGDRWSLQRGRTIFSRTKAIAARFRREGSQTDRLRRRRLPALRLQVPALSVYHEQSRRA